MDLRRKADDCAKPVMVPTHPSPKIGRDWAKWRPEGCQNWFALWDGIPDPVYISSYLTWVVVEVLVLQVLILLFNGVGPHAGCVAAGAHRLLEEGAQDRHLDTIDHEERGEAHKAHT